MALFPCRPESGGVPYMIWELSTRMYLCSIHIFLLNKPFLYYYQMMITSLKVVIEIVWYSCMIKVWSDKKIAPTSGLSSATFCTNSFKIFLGYYYKYCCSLWNSAIIIIIVLKSWWFFSLITNLPFQKYKSFLCILTKFALRASAIAHKIF